MTRWILLAALLASAGCSKKIEWGEKKATKLTVGTFDVPIPTGWRDIAELKSEELKSKLPPGVVGMMPEALSSTGFQPNIVLTWAPLQARLTPPTCAVFADMLGKQISVKTSDVQTKTVENDQVCTFKLNKDDTIGTEVARFTRDHILMVQCLRSTKGDESVDGVCTQVLTGLKLN